MGWSVSYLSLRPCCCQLVDNIFTAMLESWQSACKESMLEILLAKAAIQVII